MTSDNVNHTTTPNPVKSNAAHVRQLRAKMLAKSLPASIERKKRQIEALQAELAAMEYNLKDAKLTLAEPLVVAAFADDTSFAGHELLADKDYERALESALNKGYLKDIPDGYAVTKSGLAFLAVSRG